MKRSASDAFMGHIDADVGALDGSAIQRPGSLNLSKDQFDRMYDRIVSHYGSDSPRTLAKAKVWQKAYHASNELRASLGDPWLQRRDASWELKPVPTAGEDPSMVFFPRDWSNTLSEETLAELVIDAYSSAFCDAFLDGAISLVEVSNKWNSLQQSSGMQHSMSEPALQKPKENQRLRNTSPSHKALLEMGLVEQESTARDGFPMSGMTNDTWDAWNNRNYHKCKPLDPFVKRIAKATEAQRPQRIIAQREILEKPKKEPPVVDHRKFQFPMSRTNFPEAWERERYRQRQSPKASEVVDEDGAPPKWLIRVGKDGKTRFPYSLVSHRAFLEGQSDPILKAKAKKIAPLRLSTDPP